MGRNTKAWGMQIAVNAEGQWPGFIEPVSHTHPLFFVPTLCRCYSLFSTLLHLALFVSIYLTLSDGKLGIVERGFIYMYIQGCCRANEMVDEWIYAQQPQWLCIGARFYKQNSGVSPTIDPSPCRRRRRPLVSLSHHSTYQLASRRFTTPSQLFSYTHTVARTNLTHTRARHWRW